MANKYRPTILTVCGAGVGSSMMVRMNVDDLLRPRGIKANIINSDITSSKGNKSDILITTQDIFNCIKDIQTSEVIILNNMVSTKELESKLIPALERVLAAHEND